MKPEIVTARNLGKSFRIYHKPSDRFAEWMSLNKQKRHADFWALRDVSLSVRQGECVGLIGSNGAGKSTLLRILAGTLTPNEGVFSIKGRVLSLLELGTGFNPDLTGRQNVLHTAQLLGLPDNFAESKIREIEHFADIGSFFDMPIKICSTGMTLRIAFAMFAYFEPDVLIIDEALAVGDAAFQRKCFRRMEELIGDSKRAVILVSHDLQSIVKLCTRVYWLDDGKVRLSGDPTQVTQEYLRHTFATDQANVPAPIVASSSAGLPATSVATQNISATIPQAGCLPKSPAAILYPPKGVNILAVWLEDKANQIVTTVLLNEEFRLCYGLRFDTPIDRPVFGFRLNTTRGDCLIATNSQMMQISTGAFAAEQTVVVRWPISSGLSAGDYFISCGCSLEDDVHQFLMREVDAYQFSIVGSSASGGLCNLATAPIIASSK